MSGELQWFRLYHRMVDDEKLRLLAFEDRWHFVALCCLKASGLLDEEATDLRARKIAVKLGIQVRELEEIGRRLREVDLVDENLNPCAWNDLQYKSDSSTSRVKKFREKQQRNDVKRQRNVSVTGQETETETEELEPKGSCASDDAPVTPEELVSEWNELASDCGLPTVVKLTASRRIRAKARIRQYPDPAIWQRAFANIRASPHCLGQNDRGWKADFDFILQDKSFTRLVEGTYGTA